MRSLLILFVLWILPLASGPVRADGVPAKTRVRSQAPAPSPVPELPESRPAGEYGSIVFFPETETRPSDERFRVQAGQPIPICIRLSKQASSYIDKLSDKAIGFLLVMEDASEPPQRLNISMGNRLQPLKADAKACFGGNWKLPATAKPGVYQVADLFWATTDESFYSLRNYLYEFSRVEELEVLNPKSDAAAPKLVRVLTYKKPPYKMQFYAGVLRIRFEQGFEFEDPISALDKNSLRVFYRVEVDGTTVDLLDAKCKAVPQSNRMRCLLDIANPEILWGLNKVTLNLESVSIFDKAGNRLWLDGPKAILEQAPDAQISVVFERGKKWPHKEELDLKKDPNVPPSPHF